MLNVLCYLKRGITRTGFWQRVLAGIPQTQLSAWRLETHKAPFKASFATRVLGPNRRKNKLMLYLHVDTFLVYLSHVTMQLTSTRQGCRVGRTVRIPPVLAINEFWLPFVLPKGSPPAKIEYYLHEDHAGNDCLLSHGLKT